MIVDRKHIFISTGEASGDLLGGNLAKALFDVNPNLKIVGMGDRNMREAGVELIEDLSKMGVVGVFEIFRHLKGIYQVSKKVKLYLKEHRPDLVVLVDYSGFNLNIAKYAKKLGLRVLFYVSPQIWGSRYGRIKRIRRYVDHMAVLYQFEEGIYQRENIPVTFVGHPLTDIAMPTLSQTDVFKQLSLNSEHPVIALFPGSRTQEVTRLLPIILEAKTLIQKAIPDAQFALPIASTLDKTAVKAQLHDDITIVDNDTYNLLSITDAAIAASGTATLEIALMNVPLTILYKLSTLTYCAAMCITKTRHIGLCNIIAQEIVAQEFLQHNATPQNIASEVIKLLLDEQYRGAVKQKLAKIRGKLGAGQSAKKAATVVFEMLSK